MLGLFMLFLCPFLFIYFLFCNFGEHYLEYRIQNSESEELAVFGKLCQRYKVGGFFVLKVVEIWTEFLEPDKFGNLALKFKVIMKYFFVLFFC